MVSLPQLTELRLRTAESFRPHVLVKRI